MTLRLKISAYDLEARIATVAEARALRVGDLIEVLYTDSKRPVLELVLCDCGATGVYTDVMVCNYDLWLKRIAKRVRTASMGFNLNTDKFRRVGQIQVQAVFNRTTPYLDVTGRPARLDCHGG